eukprot:GILJ01009535.1.p1 GENE.GILJ01009535.1~~GILJ01009535.1.p1  ORF type:complete len:119 (+),score=3.74 GILJ01009535.1:730-1086(+)
MQHGKETEHTQPRQPSLSPIQGHRTRRHEVENLQSGRPVCAASPQTNEIAGQRVSAVSNQIEPDTDKLAIGVHRLVEELFGFTFIPTCAKSRYHWNPVRQTFEKLLASKEVVVPLWRP